MKDDFEVLKILLKMQIAFQKSNTDTTCLIARKVWFWFRKGRTALNFPEFAGYSIAPGFEVWLKSGPKNIEKILIDSLENYPQFKI